MEGIKRVWVWEMNDIKMNLRGIRWRKFLLLRTGIGCGFYKSSNEFSGALLCEKFLEYIGNC